MNLSPRFGLFSALIVLVFTDVGRTVALAGTWTVTPTVVSNYMFRGVRLGGPAFQPAVQYDEGNLSVGIWSNTPIRDEVAGQSDPEIDPYAWYRIALSESLSLQPGFTWYTFVNAKPGNGFYRQTFEPNLAVNWTVRGVTLTPKIYYDVVLKGATYELNAVYAYPLKTLGTELDFAATIGTYEWNEAIAEQTPAIKGWGDYWSLGVTVPYQVAANGRVSLGFAYTRGSDNSFKQGSAAKVANTAALGRGVVTLSYAMTF